MLHETLSQHRGANWLTAGKSMRYRWASEQRAVRNGAIGGPERGLVLPGRLSQISGRGQPCAGAGSELANQLRSLCQRQFGLNGQPAVHHDRSRQNPRDSPRDRSHPFNPTIPWG